MAVRSIHSVNWIRLAQEGMRFTDFYVSPTCSSYPVHAAHRNGQPRCRSGQHGRDAQRAEPGRTTRLRGCAQHSVWRRSPRCCAKTVAITPTWPGNGISGLETGQIPHARGFERDFSTLVGGGSHFDDGWNIEWQIPMMPYTEDGRSRQETAQGFLLHQGIYRQDYAVY